MEESASELTPKPNPFTTVTPLSLNNSNFFQVFIPTNLLLFWFGGWGLFESAVSYGMTMFSFGNQTLTTKVNIMTLAIILIGILCYWLIAHTEKLKIRIIKSLLLGVVSLLLVIPESFAFVISFFLSNYLLGSLHLLFYGKGINGNNPEDFFEIKAATASLLIVVFAAVVFFLLSNRSVGNLRESLKKSLIFLYILLFLTSPLIIPVVVLLPSLYFKWKP